MNALSTAIGACLELHAQAVARFGHDAPEMEPGVDPALREKIQRQRARVAATLEGDPEVHVRHVESLNAGLRIVLGKLAKIDAQQKPPTLPVWDDVEKKWIQP